MTPRRSTRLYVVIPGDLETRTGGYGYDRRIIAGLRERGWSVSVLRLDDSFPFPSAAARAQAAAVLAQIPTGSTVLVDGLALGTLPVEVEREAVRLRIVALVHHPLAAETGLDPALASELETSERRALALVRSVVVTSRATAVRLADYGVSADRITVVEPGTDPAPLAKGSEGVGRSPEPRASGGPSSSLYSARGEPVEPRATLADSSFDKLRTSGVQDRRTHETSPQSPVPSPQSPVPREVALLCVATVTPRKGYELLLTALAAIPQRNWRLTCAGSLDRDPATAARVRAQLRDSGLEDRVSLAGDMDATALGAQYDRADLFVLPSLYEGYGMAVAEALARGLPVISTATGAIEDLVLGHGSAGLPWPEPGRRQPDHAAGIVVPPGDLPALTDALFRVVGDANLRSRLAANARHVRQRLPTWEAAAAAMAEALEASSRGDGSARVGFSAEWLALREPVDHAARSLDLARAWLATLPGDRPLRVLDLGAGSGSNLRYLLDAGARPAEFLLIDHDPALLALVPKAPWVETRCMDLATLDDPTIFDGRELVTASALLDLVSDQWLHALAARCAAHGAAVLFALTYDGLIGCSPEDPDDGLIVALVNEHQRTDKGFGPALGPDAPGAAARCFEQFGYKVQRARSDWRLASDRRELQRLLIEGWAQAATEIEPARARVIDGWRDRRLAHVAAGWSEIVVGHEDLAGWLRIPRSPV